MTDCNDNEVVECDYFQKAYDEMIDLSQPGYPMFPSSIAIKHMSEILGFTIHEMSPIHDILVAIEAATENRIFTTMSACLDDDISAKSLDYYLSEIIDKDRKPRRSTGKTIEDLIAMTRYLESRGDYPMPNETLLPDKTE